jgi:hypothetical protein
MDEPDRSKPAGPPSAGASPAEAATPPAEAGSGLTAAAAAGPALSAEAATAAWVADLPPPPFVDPASPPTDPRFAHLSPRVALLIGAAIVIGLLLWMARDSVRPFVLGLLLVYLLDPPVRWLVRRGVRRTFAIAIVYVTAFLAFVEFLNLTLTPLINELIQFIKDFPALVVQFQGQLDRLSEFYARLQIPAAIREWIDAAVAGAARAGPGHPPSTRPSCCP